LLWKGYLVRLAQGLALTGVVTLAVWALAPKLWASGQAPEGLVGGAASVGTIIAVLVARRELVRQLRERP
jgi:hypothetical protein